MTPQLTKLQEFWDKNNIEYNIRYPDMFDPKWVITESRWPYFRLSTLDNQPFKEMFNEANALLSHFHVHRDDYGVGWKSLTLHGLNEDTQALEEYGDRKEALSKLHWTWVAEKCPVTTSFLKNIWPAEFLNRVRFMLLEPGGYIMPHQDRPNDQRRLSICNISLNNPNGCGFMIKDHGLIPFDDHGSAFLVDNSYEHCVWNNSDQPRIHMIIHYEIGHELRDFFYILRSSYYTNRGV